MNEKKSAPFIVIEGIDGAGTTTQSSLLCRRLSDEGRSIWQTSEPTSGPIGALLRRVLAGAVTVTPETTAHLFAADRHEHLFGDGGMVSQCRTGTVVVCDRYKYSSLAYQSVVADPSLVRTLNDVFPAPDILIYVDLPPDAGEARLATRQSREIYEQIEFQKRVYEQYHIEMERATTETTVVTVDGTLNADTLAAKIFGALQDQSIL